MNTSIPSLAAALVLASMLVSGCGGGGGSSAPPTSGGSGGGTEGTGQAAFFQGVMTKGSVIVNGVRFDDSAAVIRIDDRTGTAAELANGMVVEVRGRLNADGTTGIAERIEVENEVRATVTSVSALAQPQSFVAGGQTVIVDSGTVFANLAGIGSLPVGTRVEVHGQRDANGAIRASRVEAAASTADELKGVVANLGAGTFSLGTVTVNFGAASISPAGATLANGQPVEVHGTFSAATGVFIATRVDREDLEDAQLQPGSGEKLEIEGYVAQFNSAASTFVVNGRTVRFSTATRFEGGSAADLAGNVKIEAEGAVNAAGELVATKIELKQSRMIVQGVATAVDTVQRRLTVLGQPVRLDDLTEVRAVNAAGRDSTLLADITAGVDRVQVRARIDSSGAILAERVEETNDRDDELRGRVTAKNEAVRTLTIHGVNVSVANAQFRDTNDAPISASAFFAAIAPASAGSAGTVVQVKGVFGGGTLTAQEAELEN